MQALLLASWLLGMFLIWLTADALDYRLTYPLQLEQVELVKLP